MVIFTKAELKGIKKFSKFLKALTTEEMLAFLILEGGITEEKMVKYFKKTGTTTFALTNGYVVSYRADCNDYCWISGGEGEELFELGFGLFNAITKSNMKAGV